MLIFHIVPKSVTTYTTSKSRQCVVDVVVDKWSAMIMASGMIAAASILTILVLSPPAPSDARPTSGFPYCLRLLQCGNIEEFDGVPYDQMIIIAKNYNACFEAYKIQQTCNVQVMQDIERFHEMGFVTPR